jgi:hypothetical protein
MKPIVIDDGRTVVTPRGLISPYPLSGRNRGVRNSFAKIPADMLSDDERKPEVLRQVLSARVEAFRENRPQGQRADGKKAKLIPAEEFYPEMWNAEEYEAPSVESFFEAFSRVVRRDENCAAIQRGDWIFAYGTEKPEYRNSDRPIDDKHFVFRSILLPDPEDREIVMSSFRTRMAPAVPHCAIVARRYLRDGRSMYKHFKRKTVSKVRDIWAPEEDVKAALRHLLQPLNAAYDMRKRGGSPQFAYTPERNIKLCAAPHRLNKWLLKCDITGFFDACSWELTRGYLEFLLAGHWDVGRDKRAAWIDALRQMMINPETGGLYQGSPVSGALSNAILRPAAKYMESFFNKEGRAVTVYADDISVSQATEIDQAARNNIIGKIRHAFEKFEMPFELKQSKTKVVRNNGRKITGIRINHKDELTIPRRKYRLLRLALHRMIETDEGRGGDISLGKAELKGLLEFARYNDDSGKIDKLIRRYLDVLRERGIKFRCYEEELEAIRNEEGFGNNSEEAV